MSQTTPNREPLPEETYRALIESAPDAVVLINSDGSIVLVNEQTERLFGHARADLLGCKIESLVPMRYRERHQLYRDRFFSDPKFRPMGMGVDLWGLRRDGSEFPVEISLSPIRAGERLYAAASIRDATERRKAAQKFRDLLETAPDGMVIVNTKGLIQLVNAQVERLFGYKRDVLIGQPVEVLIPEDTREQHANHRDGYIEAPTLREMGTGKELWGRRKDGSRFPVEISLSPLETEEGTWTTAAVRDVSDRKAADDQLQQYARNLERSNRDLERFAYIASHDLQAPLRNLAGFSQLLGRKLGGDVDKETAEFLEFIQGGAHQMQELIEGLLQLSRVGRTVSGKMTAVDLNEVLTNVEWRLKSVIEARSATVESAPLPTVHGVASELSQLFQNLIENALKFHRDEAPRVEIGGGKEGGFHHLWVRDYGIGIPAAKNEIIFQIFKRLHTNEEYEGTGIGLALCSRIVQHHGGRIWVESEPGAGSTFHFTLADAV